MTLLWIAVLLAGIGAIWCAGRLWRKGRISCRMLAAGVFLVGLISFLVGGYGAWFMNRRPPMAAQEAWFEGITYERVVLQAPRPIVAHVVHVDLDSPGVELIVTPADAASEKPLLARTTSDFARQHAVQLAINANFYFPFHASHPLSYYPHSGDRVQVAGFAAADGSIYHADPWKDATFYIAQDGRASFERPSDGLWSAIAGSTFLVRDGRTTGKPTEGEPGLYARTALGLDAAGRQLILVIIEGKQPGRSTGMTISELAKFMQDRGAHNAINLDGGGSSTLVRQTSGDRWSMVNCTSNFKLPWWERPVANHLGIFAQPCK